MNTTQKFVRKQAAVLSAATFVINEYGLKDTTISKLAESADMATTSITYYFKRKEDLVAACYRYAFEKINRIIAQAEAAPSPAERLRLLIEHYFNLQYEIAVGKTAPLLSWVHLRALTGSVASELFEAYTIFFRSVRNLIRPENFDNTNRSQLNACTRFLIAQINWSGRWLSRYQSRNYARAADRIIDILTYGACPNHQQWREAHALEHEPSSNSKETFLKAATELINVIGYRSASLDKIAAKLRRTKGSFYHHYKNKDELVEACYERTFAIINTILSRSRKAGNHHDQINHAISNIVRFQLDPAGPLLDNVAIGVLSPERKTKIYNNYYSLSRILADLVIDGIIDGSLRPLDPYIASNMLTTTIFSSPDLAPWIPGVNIDNASALYVRPFFEGIFYPVDRYFKR
jgi:AcrR family transcriptional regulator